MTDVERVVWCAAFGAAVVCRDYYWGDEIDGLTDDGRRAVAREQAARAVRLLDGPSRDLDPDLMAAVATAGET